MFIQAVETTGEMSFGAIYRTYSKTVEKTALTTKPLIIKIVTINIS